MLPPLCRRFLFRLDPPHHSRIGALDGDPRRLHRHVVPRAGEIVTAAATRGRPRAGLLGAARRGRPSPASARRWAPDCEGDGTEEARD